MREAKSVAEALSLIEHDTSKTLGLTINGKPVGKGDYLPKQESHSTPEITLPNPSSTITYSIACVDIDPPFPSWNVFGPALHWFQPGLKATVDGIMENVENAPAIAHYLGAGPPPGSSPHRYLFILYEQSERFNVQKWGKSFSIPNRMRFDLDRFEVDTGLGKIAGATFFFSN